MRLERFHVSEDRVGALEAFGFDVGGLVAIEKLRHVNTQVMSGLVAYHSAAL